MGFFCLAHKKLANYVALQKRNFQDTFHIYGELTDKFSYLNDCAFNFW